MERLTEKHYLAEDHYMKCSGNCHMDINCIDCPAFDRLVERLAAYEDTGLTPEGVEYALRYLNSTSTAEIKGFEGVSVDRLLELAAADKEDRVVVLPCKVGDTIWRLKRTFETYPDRSKPYVEPDAFLLQDVWDAGKTVFLTRDEAEKALEEMEGRKEANHA